MTNTVYSSVVNRTSKNLDPENGRKLNTTTDILETQGREVFRIF